MDKITFEFVQYIENKWARRVMLILLLIFWSIIFLVATVLESVWLAIKSILVLLRDNGSTYKWFVKTWFRNW